MKLLASRLSVLAAVALSLWWVVPTQAQSAADHPVIHHAAATKLEPIPGAPACLTWALESGEPSSGPATWLGQFSPDCGIPWHWHTPDEHLMEVSGILAIEAKGEKPARLARGDYGLMPAKHVHRARCVSKGPCSFFLYSEGVFDIHYVDDGGKEIPPSEALKGEATAPEPSKKP